jgi:hypothetical protein
VRAIFWAIFLSKHRELAMRYLFVWPNITSSIQVVSFDRLFLLKRQCKWGIWRASMFLWTLRIMVCNTPGDKATMDFSIARLVVWCHCSKVFFFFFFCEFVICSLCQIWFGRKRARWWFTCQSLFTWSWRHKPSISTKSRCSFRDLW